MGVLLGVFLCKDYLFGNGFIDKKRIFSKSKWQQFLFLNINIVVRSNQFKNSRDKVIELINKINWENGFYRKDIGYKVID